MRNVDHTTWTRLTAAALASRDSWRFLIRQPGIPPALRQLAAEQSAQLSDALKRPSQQPERKP
jgi:hypothetical protein